MRCVKSVTTFFGTPVIASSKIQNYEYTTFRYATSVLPDGISLTASGNFVIYGTVQLYFPSFALDPAKQVAADISTRKKPSIISSTDPADILNLTDLQNQHTINGVIPKDIRIYQVSPTEVEIRVKASPYNDVEIFMVATYTK